MTSVGFGALLASGTFDDAGFSVDLPENWAQGRTAFGGLSAALCVEAARRAHPDLPPLRSAQFAFAGPATGRLRARTTLVRKGRSAALVSATLDGDAGPAAQAFLTFGAPRQSTIAHARRVSPTVPLPDRCEPFNADRRGPRFMSNFDMRFAAGATLLSGGDPDITLWIRHNDAVGADPVTALVALADSLPPAAMTQFTAPAPISTMTWSFDVFAHADPGAWHLLRSESENARDGYSAQAMTVWDANGALLVSGRQLIAVFA